MIRGSNDGDDGYLGHSSNFVPMTKESINWGSRGVVVVSLMPFERVPTEMFVSLSLSFLALITSPSFCGSSSGHGRTIYSASAPPKFTALEGQGGRLELARSGIVD